MNKIAIAFDFCGVLDIQNSHTVKDNTLSIRIAKMANWKLCYRLFKLIDKYDLNFFSTSTLQKYADVFQSCMKAIADSEDEEAMAFAKVFRKGKGRKNKIRCGTDWTIKNALLFQAVKQASIDTVITLEDDEPIDQCYNPIRVSTSKRMTDAQFKALEDRIIMAILNVDVIDVSAKWNNSAPENEQWVTLSRETQLSLYNVEISLAKDRLEKITDECDPRKKAALTQLIEQLSSELTRYQ